MEVITLNYLKRKMENIPIPLNLLTPIKRKLVEIASTAFESIKRLSTENMTLRKQLDLGREPELFSSSIMINKKERAVSKVNEFTKKFKIMENISISKRFAMAEPPKIVKPTGVDVNEFRAQQISASFPLLVAYVNKVYEFHDVAFVQNHSRNNALQKEKQALAVSLQNIALCVVQNRCNSVDGFGDVYKKQTLSTNDRRRFNKRVSAFVDVGCLMFKCSKAAHLGVFLVLWFKREIIQLLQHLSAFERLNHLFTPKDALFIHFAGGQSYRTSEKYFQAIRFKSEGNVSFPGMTKIREYRDSLPIGQIDIFENPEGKKKGRYWAFSDMIPRSLENATIVQNMKFLGAGAGDAELLLEFHLDGVNANFSKILCGVSRWVGLGDSSRNPAALHINFLDEAKEDCVVFDKLFKDCIMPGLLDCYDEEDQSLYCYVRCLHYGIEAGHCQLCKRGVPCEEVTAVDGNTKMMKHKVRLSMIYCCDEKAFKLMLPIQPAICRRCTTNLRKKDHSFRTGKVGSPHTLKSFQHADKEVRAACKTYEEKHLLQNMCADAMERFYSDDSFKDVCKSQDSEGAYMFKSFLCDFVTPLSNYLTDTLHFSIILANLVLNRLILPLVVAVEELHPGVGVHTFYVACKLAGLRHLGKRLREYARSKYGSKIVRFGDVQHTIATAPGVLLDEAIKSEAVRSVVPRWKISHARKVLKRLLPREQNNRVDRMNLQDVRAELRRLLPELDYTKFKVFFSHEELEMVDNKLSLSNAEKMIVKDGESLNIDAMMAAAGVKLQGRDAKILFQGGGGEKLIKHLCPLLVNLRIRCHSKLNKVLEKLASFDAEVIALTQHKKAIFRHVSLLHDVDADEIKSPDFNQKLNECFDAVIGDDSEEGFHRIRHDIQDCGDEILALLSDDDVCEQDLQTKHTLHIFSALKNIVLPIIRPCSENSTELLADLDGHDSRVHQFEKLLTRPEVTVNFGDKSDYMHWMKFHAKEECSYVLKRWGIHISKFSCQTSEHFNKILKRLVEKLHGFTNLSVNGRDEWKNKFGFIMQQFQIRYLHFYETFSSLSTQACSKCQGKGHNRRTCVG